jgi:hypothetical protein
MRTQFILAALAGLAITGAALADDHAKDRRHENALTSISAETMRQKIDGLGYDVRRLKSEHGRFEAHIVDRQSGGGVEAVFSAGTGELLRAKLSRPSLQWL